MLHLASVVPSGTPGGTSAAAAGWRSCQQPVPTTIREQPQLLINCTTQDKLRPHHISYTLKPHPKAPIYTFLYLPGSQTL